MNDSNPAAGRIWLRDYPPDVPAEIDPDSIPSLKHLYEDAFRRFAGVTAYANMGRSLSYADVDEQSRRFAAWLQKEAGLAAGDRVAIMMPNLLQYPIAIVGAHRAGCVVVNVNPLYTARELEHQLKDSGATVIVIFENAAATLEQVIARTPVRKVVVTGIGDLLGFPKVRDHQLRDPQGTQDGAGVLAAGRGALQRRARERRLAEARSGGRVRRGRRLPAVHGRHDRRFQGRRAHAPEHGREHPAGRRLHAGARGVQESRRHHGAAALPHLRADDEHAACSRGSAATTC